MLRAMSHLPQIAFHIGAALAAGGIIGLERTYHGRPAGFRTHALVCLASSALMMVTLWQREWFPSFGESVRVDPTRMAQGIMTGIGFLGAGVIFRDGLTVRGLTTAASIWTTAAVGILLGVGLWLPGALVTVIALGVLSVFHRIEALVPSHRFAHFSLRFERDSVMAEAEVIALVQAAGVDASGLSYRLADAGRLYEYGMTLRTLRPGGFGRLSARLAGIPSVREFHIAPY